MGLFNINDFANKPADLRKSLVGIDGFTKKNIEFIIARLPYPNKEAFRVHLEEIGIKKSFRDRIEEAIDVKPSRKVNPRMDLLAKKSLNRIINTHLSAQKVFGRMLNVLVKLGNNIELTLEDEVFFGAYKAEPTAAKFIGRLLTEYAKDENKLGRFDEVLNQGGKGSILASVKTFDERVLMNEINNRTGRFDKWAFQLEEEDGAETGRILTDPTDDDARSALSNEKIPPEGKGDEGEKGNEDISEKTVTIDDRGNISVTTKSRKDGDDDISPKRPDKDDEIPPKDPEFENRITNLFNEKGVGYAISIHTIECKDVNGTFFYDLFDDELAFVFQGDVMFKKSVFPVIVPTRRPREDVNEGDVLSDMRNLCKEDDEKSEHLLDRDETRLVNRLAYLGQAGFSPNRQDAKNSTFNLDEYIELEGKLMLFESNDEIRRLIRRIFRILKRLAKLARKAAGTISFGGGDFVDFVTEELNVDTFDDIELIILELIDEKQEIGFANFMINAGHIEEAFKTGKVESFENSFEFVTDQPEQIKEAGDEGSRGLYEIKLRYERYKRKQTSN
ncbi:hypothetical protein [Cyclobacterium salsum]|uniref:hypothetical protein n=1 Tax=Cyclobacterium salsum TaxID=2666329 RepID=UPI00139137A6|nr:hypothetical protein [Cyclobacterium salsum]